MTSPSESVYMAGGLTSDHDVEIFKAWQKCVPHNWTIAKVDTRGGLMLIDNTSTRGHEVTLRFTHALCGYTGSGPIASIEILVLAGFGTREEITEIIHGYLNYTFTKPQL